MFAHEKAIRTLHLKGNLCLHLKKFCLVPENVICTLSLKNNKKKGNVVFPFFKIRICSHLPVTI